VRNTYISASPYCFTTTATHDFCLESKLSWLAVACVLRYTAVPPMLPTVLVQDACP
jgi:hypothetical protein